MTESSGEAVRSMAERGSKSTCVIRDRSRTISGCCRGMRSLREDLDSSMGCINSNSLEESLSDAPEVLKSEPGHLRGRAEQGESQHVVLIVLGALKISMEMPQPPWNGSRSMVVGRGRPDRTLNGVQRL